MFDMNIWNQLNNDQKREILMREGIPIIDGLVRLIVLWILGSWFAGIIGGISIWAIVRFQY